MEKIIKSKCVIRQDVELQSQDEKKLFTVTCYNGHATAIFEKRTILLTYPKLEELTAQQRLDVLDYQGLPHAKTIRYDDVMMKFGEEK